MSDIARGIWQLLAIAWRVDWRKTAAGLALAVASAMTVPLLAVLLRQTTNAVLAGRPGAAAWYGGLVALLTITMLSFRSFIQITYWELAELAERDFVEQMMVVSNGSARIEHHEQPDFADTLTVLGPDSRRFPAALQALFNSVGLLLAVIFTAVLLARLNPFLLLLPLAAIPPLLAGKHATVITERAKTRTATQARIARNLFRLSASPRFAGELRVFRLGDELRKRHAELWDGVSRARWRADAYAAAIRAAGQVIFGLAYIGAVILIIREAIAGHRSVGDVVLVIALAAQVNQQVIAAVGLMIELQRMGGTLNRLDSMRALVANAEPLAGQEDPPERLTHGIELDHASFRYPGTDDAALSDVSLVLPAGSTVAIIGENGAGKSTLVKLLCGLYSPSAGRVLVDGSDLLGISLERWRARITAGFQDFVRYELAARTVVGLGDLPRADDDDAVLLALDQARGADIVSQLADGLDTLLGTSYAAGAELSGGQWQKLALGRAFMRETPLMLVLDEPTAALDPQAEHQLFEHYALRARRVAQLTGAITLIVSHRFSTVKMADLIIVLRDGRVEEAGDHSTLLDNGGLYAELFSLQAKAYR
jgi:ATP-binding cassette, subfamily B, bacterial